jgi:hypothetical protein
MNTTTQERPCIETVIVDGALVFGKVTMRRDFVDSPDIAIHRLLLGETVQLFQRAATVTAVQRTIEATLAQSKPIAPLTESC